MRDVTAHPASAARACTVAHIAARKERDWEQVPAFWERLDAPGP